MRMTFNKACEIIKKYYGKENIEQVWKPDGKNYYIVNFTDGKGKNFKKEDILSLV